MSPTPPLTRYTARSPEDLLAVAPVVLGFHPAESVVLLTFGLQRPFHARIDLPDLPRGPDERRAVLDELAAQLLGPVRRYRPASVVLLFYSPDARTVDDVWRHLRRECRGLAVPVVDALRSDAGRYYPLLADDRRLRETGVPVDLASHPFTARAVLDGTVVHESREQMAATVAPDPAARARVAAVLQRSLARRAAPRTPREVRLVGGAVREVVARHVARRSVPDDVEAAWLLWAVRAVRARDAAWALVTRADAREHVALWTDLSRRAPAGHVAAPTALLAWAAWLAGDGALAWVALDRCVEADPGYRLAGLVRAVVEQAIDPAALDEPFAWDAGLDDAG